MGLFKLIETETQKTEVTEVTEVTSPKSLGKERLQNVTSRATEVTSPKSLDKNGEGPPYPDGLGRVKCVYCARLDRPSCPTGERYGISLLRQCQHYESTEG